MCEEGREGWDGDREVWRSSKTKGCGKVRSPCVRAWTLPEGVADSQPAPFSAPPPGTLFSKRALQRTLRFFTLGVRKEFGLGTWSTQERVLEEAACLLGEFQATIGAACWREEGGLVWAWHIDQVGNRLGGTKPVSPRASWGPSHSVLTSTCSYSQEPRSTPEDY